MRIQYASDLHLEFAENYQYFLDNPLQPTAPYLVLAGDIDIISTGEVTRPEFFQYLSEHWIEVFIVPGNHEWYRHGDVSKSFHLDLKIHHNVRYLNHQKVHLDGVDLFFSTLWSMTRSSIIKNLISDFRQSKYGSNPFTFKDHDRFHEKAVSWLRKQLMEEKKYPRVLVSHFVPCKEANGYPVSDDKYLGPIVNRYFVADLSSRIVDWDIDYWIYGHNHWNMDVNAMGTKFRSNQFGYLSRMEHVEFNSEKIITL